MALAKELPRGLAATEPPTDLHREVAVALERITVGVVAITVRALAEAVPGVELTLQQWRAILIIGRDPAGARVGAVAAQVGVTLPATGRALRRLAARGLIALGKDETDRRATIARLTPAGQEVRDAVLAYRGRILLEVARQLVAGTGPGRTPPATPYLDEIGRLLESAI